MEACSLGICIGHAGSHTGDDVAKEQDASDHNSQAYRHLEEGMMML